MCVLGTQLASEQTADKEFILQEGFEKFLFYYSITFYLAQSVVTIGVHPAYCCDPS